MFLVLQVLDGDKAAAEKLAEEVHKEVHIDDIDVGTASIPPSLALPIGSLGVWIDPIGKLF